MKDVADKLRLHDVAAMMESQRDPLTARGYVVAVEPHGQNTIGGHRGVRLRATRLEATHTLSVEIDIDALKHVTVHVDGKLRENRTSFAFPKNERDFVDGMREEIKWFVGHYLTSAE
jgi:hypothetical protein